MTTTVAELLVETLIKNGIDQLYCLPGIQNDVFFDALYHHTDRLTPVLGELLIITENQQSV